MKVDWVQTKRAHQRVEWLGQTVELFQPTTTLEDIVPEQRPKFEALIAYAKSFGMTIKVRSAGRTCATQQSYYDLGEQITQANLCRSMHVFGHAVDFDLVPNTCLSYTKLGEWWEKQGGVWGGRWKQFGPCGDMGHFHIGMNGAQAVPTSLCPANVTESECKKIREDYLTKAFGQATPTTSTSSRMGILSGLLIAGAAAALLYATLNVRAPVRVRENRARTVEQAYKDLLEKFDEEMALAQEAEDQGLYERADVHSRAADAADRRAAKLSQEVIDGKRRWEDPY